MLFWLLLLQWYNDFSGHKHKNKMAKREKKWTLKIDECWKTLNLKNVELRKISKIGLKKDVKNLEKKIGKMKGRHINWDPKNWGLWGWGKPFQVMQ
jgi:hypothetical protein